MNRSESLALTLLLLVLLAAAGCQTSRRADRDERVSLAQVPPGVQRTINEHLAGGKIDEIERSIEKGKTLHDVEVEGQSGDFEFAVAEDGSFLGMDTEDEDQGEGDEDEGNDDDGEDEDGEDEDGEDEDDDGE